MKVDGAILFRDDVEGRKSKEIDNGVERKLKATEDSSYVFDREVNPPLAQSW